MFISDSEIGGAVRQNWALLVTIGVLLGGAGFMYAMDTAESPTRSANVDVVVLKGQANAVSSAAPSQKIRKTTQELALEQIAEHEAKVLENPGDENTPAYLMAMGNLYRQKLLDYEKAAECYERLLYDYEDYDAVRVVYMQLATCYERLGQRDEAKKVYEQMMDVFPAESQEYKIARDAVYR